MKLRLVIYYSHTLKDNKLKNFQSNLSGKLTKLFLEIFFVGAKYLSLENPNNLEDFGLFYSNGCNVHPHQIYIQLLAELE